MRKHIYTILLLLFTFHLFGQTVKILPSDGTDDDQFGTSVALYQDIAVVGSQKKNNSQGAVYVFRKNNDIWEEEAILTANDGLSNDKFGHSVAIDGDYIIVGAHGSDAFGNNSGAAYIFHYNGSNWDFQAKITPNEPSAAETFGVSVSISGEYAIVGGNHAHINGNNNVGAAYIFHRAGSFWTQQAKLTASDGALNDYFGQAVAIDGNNAIISAQFADDKGTNSGAAYIFKRTGATSWEEITKIYGSDTDEYNYFGCSVAIKGDHAIVGAYFNKTENVKIGAAYIFKFDAEWTEQLKLTGSNSAVNDNFGYSVAIADSFAIVGAYAHEDGAVYVYKNRDSIWSEEMIVYPNEVSTEAEFGKAIATNNETLLIGALKDNAMGDESGAAFITPADTTTVTGIDFLPGSNNEVTVYPNPASGKLTIKINGNEKIQSLEIFDTPGRRVFFSKTESNSYDISGLKDGIYFLVIRTNKGSYAKTIVKGK